MTAVASFSPGDLKWSGTEYVAVGEGRLDTLSQRSSLLLTSRDGSDWVPHPDLGGTAVAVGDGRVVVIAGNAVHSCPDGATWSTVVLSPSVRLRGVAWTGRQFVALGFDATTGRTPAFLSTDGSAWTPAQTIGLPRVDGLGRLGGGGGTMVAVGDHGSTAFSYDGWVWTPTTTALAQSLWDVAWSDGRYVAVGLSGEILSSDDGLAWHAQPSPLPGSGLQAVAAGGGRWLALGWTGLPLTGTDGVHWTPSTSAPLASFTAAMWDGHRFVVAGAPRDPATLAWIGAAVWATTDGSDWVRIDDGTALPFDVLIWAGSYYLGIGSGSVYTSLDGVHWSTLPLGTFPMMSYMLAATWNGRAVVVTGFSTQCDVGCCGCCGGFALSTTDGATWTQTEVGRELNGAVWEGRRFVAVGECGSLVTSPDGITWATELGLGHGQAPLMGVAASPTSVVAVGADSILYRPTCPPPHQAHRHLGRTSQ